MSPKALFSGVVMGGTLLLAGIGPAIAPYDPERPTPDILEPPSLAHPMGTDASGIDVFSVVLAAFRVDIFIAVVSVGISLIIGVALGAFSAYSFNRRRLASTGSALILRSLDFVQSIPVFILALALVATLGPSIRNVIIAVAFVNVPLFARLTRTSVLSTEGEEFVSAARALGQRESSILLRHVLPNSLDSTIASASVGVGIAVLLTAGLSFLGAGIRPPTPEWGAEIASGANYVITGQWWIGVLPGLVLSFVVLGFAVSGDVIRTMFARTRGRAVTPSVDIPELVVTK